MTNLVPENKILIQFDGMCVLCSRTVRFIMNHDKNKKFIFQINSEENVNPETVIVWHNNVSYQYFDAVLKIGKELGGIFRVVEVFRIIPKKWRKRIYLVVAKNRYKWFGRLKSCYLPKPEERQRFIQNSKSSFSN